MWLVWVWVLVFLFVFFFNSNSKQQGPLSKHLETGLNMESKAIKVDNSLDKAYIEGDEDDDDLYDPIHKKNISFEIG